MKRLLYILFLPFLIAAMPVNPAYVSSSGSGSTCTSGSPCALSYANTNAAAGDVVILQDGTYTTAINPSNSGSLGSVITYQAQNKGSAIISVSGYGLIISKDYIKLDGITLVDCIAAISAGSYNEITNTEIYRTTQDYIAFLLGIYAADGVSSTHNWIHGNTFHDATYAGCNEGTDLIKVGSYAAAQKDNDHNTISSNILYRAGHSLGDDYGHSNAWINNIGHNEGHKADSGSCNYKSDPAGKNPGNGQFGHRCFALSVYEQTNNENMYRLFEGNRAGYASINPNNRGAESLTLESSGNIIRFNKMFGADAAAIDFKNGAGASNNRVYNNTIYKSGQYTGTCDTATCISAPPVTKSLMFTDGAINNYLKNNIMYQAGSGDVCASGGGCVLSSPNYWSNNLCDATNTDYACTALTSSPLADATISDMTSLTLPTLKIISGSQPVKAGTSLTLANGAGAASTSLTVDDALYFQAGSEPVCGATSKTNSVGSCLSNIPGDYILINGQIRQVMDINYATNVLTLDSAATWADNAPVYLYKKSDGVQVSYGGVMDIGAEPFTGNASVGTGAGFSLGVGASISIQ